MRLGWRWTGLGLAGIAALLAACSGSGGGATSGTGGGTTGGGTADTCSLVARQDWAAAQLREWYLFPETLPTALSPAGFSTVGDYIDALTATARAQRRDRFFTFITSIAEENAFLASGSSAGFGFRVSTDTIAQRVFIAETFEGTAAFAAGVDRGAEILAIGTSTATLRAVNTIIAAEGSAGITNALGPSTAGLSRVLRVRDTAGTRDVTLTKTDYALLPVSPRYGAQIINDGARRVGYLNLRTFISSADQPLRDAFNTFRNQGITDIIIDFRYNGGGLVSTSELMGDLLGGNRAASEVFSFTTFRPEKAANNSTRLFRPQPQSAAPVRLAFIGAAGTASASENVINSMQPYFRRNLALVGTNTFGKPVGQIAVDRAQCDDRLRIVAFASQNSARQGDFYDGLARTLDVTCQAADDFSRPLGDPQEASVRAALNFLAGQSCTAIAAAGGTGLEPQSATATLAPPPPLLLMPDRPDPAQRYVPGLF
ncbi:S41 family peptidase [Sphingomonas sp.]|uniref:S41 family peptidase n=1 Tax=Sphingomonas sp. TaxID=28214 RepID=UPI001D67DBCC|nr:S41 family peptidase [Sphingomonas sp.]MBX9796593.1 peptidase S41 [Sphingomonas sp.]